MIVNDFYNIVGASLKEKRVLVLSKSKDKIRIMDVDKGFPNILSINKKDIGEFSKIDIVSVINLLGVDNQQVRVAIQSRINKENLNAKI